MKKNSCLKKRETKLSFFSRKALRFKTSQGNEIWVEKMQRATIFGHQNCFSGLLASCKRLAWFPRDFKNKNKENEEEEIQKQPGSRYFSSVRGESRAEVIVTQVKYVRTLPSQIGKVTYRREKLFSLNPSYPRCYSLVNHYPARQFRNGRLRFLNKALATIPFSTFLTVHYKNHNNTEEKHLSR